MEEKTSHISVLLNEVVDVLKAKESGDFLDCTLGGGGHTEAILEAHPSNNVVAIDRDLRALKRAEKRFSDYKNRVKVVHGRFSNLSPLLEGRKFNGILADLGISTDQLKEDRGFSFTDPSELDMRMDESESRSAHWVVNEMEPSELYKTLRRGGVGNEAHAITQAIVNARPIHTTKELSQVINKAAPGKKGKKVNPSTVPFQAIRIAVNDEFEEINKFLDGVTDFVMPGARLAVITFHSLEDKLVASRMREWEGGSSEPALWPGARQPKKLGKLVSRKPIMPSEEELERNPSARSARLRVFEFE